MKFVTFVRIYKSCPSAKFQHSSANQSQKLRNYIFFYPPFLTQAPPFCLLFVLIRFWASFVLTSGRPFLQPTILFFWVSKCLLVVLLEIELNSVNTPMKMEVPKQNGGPSKKMKILALGPNSTKFCIHNQWAVIKLKLTEQNGGGLK